MNEMMTSRLFIFLFAWLFGVDYRWAKERRIAFLQSERNSIGDRIERLIKLKHSGCSEVEKKLLELEIEKSKKEYLRIEDEINILLYEKKKNGRVDDLMIQNARAFPFSELISIPSKGNVRCPFHDDKHPSASVRNNVLHCFTCNRSWNPIDYVMEMEGLSFRDAVLRLK